jgi:hypothetical protein
VFSCVGQRTDRPQRRLTICFERGGGDRRTCVKTPYHVLLSIPMLFISYLLSHVNSVTYAE